MARLQCDEFPPRAETSLWSVLSTTKSISTLVPSWRMIFATELLSQSGRDNFQLLFFRLTGIQAWVNLCSPRIRWAKGKAMNTNPIPSVMLTTEICPNCKGEMTITEAGPVLLNDHLETITYQCKACSSKLKRTFELRSGEWKPIHLSLDAQYRIAFFKHLLSSDGHQFKCLQHVIAIRHARNAERALKAAEHRYERLYHVSDWRLYADTFELEA